MDDYEIIARMDTNMETKQPEQKEDMPYHCTDEVSGTGRVVKLQRHRGDKSIDMVRLTRIKSQPLGHDDDPTDEEYQAIVNLVIGAPRLLLAVRQYINSRTSTNLAELGNAMEAVVPPKQITDKEAMDEIHRLLVGSEQYTDDTAGEVEKIVRRAGRKRPKPYTCPSCDEEVISLEKPKPCHKCASCPECCDCWDSSC